MEAQRTSVQTKSEGMGWGVIREVSGKKWPLNWTLVDVHAQGGKNQTRLCRGTAWTKAEREESAPKVQGATSKKWD